MGTKASIEMRSTSAREQSSKDGLSKSSATLIDNLSEKEKGKYRRIYRRERQEFITEIQEKNQTIENLTKENDSLRKENETLQNEVEELKSRPMADGSHSRISLSSAISGHSNRTDASAFQGSSWIPGSPWSTAHSLSPDVSRLSVNGQRPRRAHFLLPMNDIEAYGKGLNPNQSHYLFSRTPSPRSIATKDSLEEDELNGNSLENESR